MKRPPFSPLRSELSRREFLGRLSVGAAGFALAARLRAADASAASGKKLGVALVGLGSYSTGQPGPALKVTKNCQLAGVVTGDPAKGRK
jgi:glucose-fructose oxidoreductase